MSSPGLLLCTDLDRTLLPNGPQPESRTARARFAQLAAHEAITLVYVTGRDRRLVEKAMLSYQLPEPDFVISDVGTNIYDHRDGRWDVWPQWQAEIATDWGGKGHAELHHLLSDIQGLRLQERSKQNTFKLSYYLPLHVDQNDLHREVALRLEAHQVRASLGWSIDEPAGIGLLDVLPERATQLHAIEFLRRHLGFELNQTVFAGDSGNDLPVLASAVPSVLVANAPPSVAATAVAAAERTGNREALYLASGTFERMNGNYSAGILEGVAHYHPAMFDGIGQAAEAANGQQAKRTDS